MGDFVVAPENGYTENDYDPKINHKGYHLINTTVETTRGKVCGSRKVHAHVRLYRGEHAVFPAFSAADDSLTRPFRLRFAQQVTSSGLDLNNIRRPVDG